MRIPRPRHHVVAAYLALFVSLGGTAYAATAIYSSDIVDGEVKAPDLGTLPNIVVGDTGPNQSMSTGQDSAVRFGAPNTSRSSIEKTTNSTRFRVNQTGLYSIAAQVRTEQQVMCNGPGNARCGGYAVAKLVRYANGTGSAITLAADQVAIALISQAGQETVRSDLQPAVIARLQAGDDVSVLEAADVNIGQRTVLANFTVPTQTAAAQPLFTMHYVGK